MDKKGWQIDMGQVSAASFMRANVEPCTRFYVAAELQKFFETRCNDASHDPSAVLAELMLAWTNYIELDRR